MPVSKKWYVDKKGNDGVGIILINFQNKQIVLDDLRSFQAAQILQENRVGLMSHLVKKWPGDLKAIKHPKCLQAASTALNWHQSAVNPLKPAFSSSKKFCLRVTWKFQV